MPESQPQPEPDAPAELPETVGVYRVERELGRGGMGVVYAAVDPRLQRRVAIKVISADRAMEGERVAQFEREATLLAALNHPSIATIHALDEADGHLFFVLEFIPGESLSEHLACGPIKVARVLSYALQMARGLEAAHEAGIVHLDLKPANIHITPRDEVKILDFGIARALRGGDDGQGERVSGTPGYMSPEQLLGRAVDERADAWAFGCMLYECLTGKPAFRRDTINESIAATSFGELGFDRLPEETPACLREVLESFLERDVEKRSHDFAQVCHKIEDELAVSRQKTAFRSSVEGVLGDILQVGCAAPPFELEDARGTLVRSRDLLERGPLVINFYRGKW